MRDIEMLRREGVRRLVVIGLVNTVLDSDAMWEIAAPQIFTKLTI